MLWNRSIAIGIANAGCTTCLGVGTALNNEGDEVVCGCVLRHVFRACFDGFVECVALGDRTASVSLEPCSGPRGGRIYSRKREEYIADFLGVTERSLNEQEYRLFRYYFLLRADYTLCCDRLNLDRGTFFHEVYRLEAKLGRVYAELQPYALYPLRDYFGGVARKGVTAAKPLCQASQRPRRIRLPLSA